VRIDFHPYIFRECNKGHDKFVSLKHNNLLLKAFKEYASEFN